MKFIKNFELDLWTLWGLIAQGLFFLRFIIQWYFSEKKGKTVIPVIFWHISLTASFMILIYAIVRRDIVFLITGILQTFLYSRNLVIARKKE